MVPAMEGAYRADLTYQRSDLELVVSYAADRAIRVVPEIDLPGHAASFAIGRPVDLLPLLLSRWHLFHSRGAADQHSFVFLPGSVASYLCRLC